MIVEAKVILMQSKPHKKHTNLPKREGGKYHANEFTLIGAPCGQIKELVQSLSKYFQSVNLQSGYLDMSHESEAIENEYRYSIIDKQEYFQVKINRSINEYELNTYFETADLLFVNGNHFYGKNQVVIVNSKKRDSLKRKMERLDDVLCVLLAEGEAEVFDFLREHISESVPVFTIKDQGKIKQFLHAVIEDVKPALNGLVLIGGKSFRMGENKALIKYYDKYHMQYEAEMLSSFCSKTYYSISSKSSYAEELDFEVIEDKFIGLGPIGGILSAFHNNPNVAWLSLACDLPFLDAGTIELLVNSRDRSKVATCFHNPETNFPEPLITIWEPRAYPILLNYLSKGHSCPRKVLIDSEVKTIELSEVFRLKNANTPAEQMEAKEKIQTL